MMRLLELTPDLVVAPDYIAAIRRVGDSQCTVILRGCSPVDAGLLVDRSFEDVVEEVEGALEELDGGDSDEEDEA